MATQGFPALLLKQYDAKNRTAGGDVRIENFAGKNYVVHNFSRLGFIPAESWDDDPNTLGLPNQTGFSSTFSVFDDGIFAHVFMIGGGGSGGAGGGSGGGGAGGALLNFDTWDADVDATKNPKVFIPKGNHLVTVGGGGAERPNLDEFGNNGTASIAFGIRASGGGGGGARVTDWPPSASGRAGGSGGGQGRASDATFGRSVDLRKNVVSGRIASVEPIYHSYRPQSNDYVELPQNQIETVQLFAKQGNNGAERVSSSVGGAGGGAGGPANGVVGGAPVFFLGRPYGAGGGVGTGQVNSQAPGSGSRGGTGVINFSYSERGRAGAVIIAYEVA